MTTRRAYAVVGVHTKAAFAMTGPKWVSQKMWLRSTSRPSSSFTVTRTVRGVISRLRPSYSYDVGFPSVRRSS